MGLIGFNLRKSTMHRKGNRCKSKGQRRAHRLRWRRQNIDLKYQAKHAKGNRIDNLGEGDSYLLLNVLPEQEHVFDSVRGLNFSELLHQNRQVSRKAVVHGSVTEALSPMYRHPTDNRLPVEPWDDTTRLLAEAVSKNIGHEVNHALIQLYSSGAAHISPHSDKTLDILRGTPIASLSLGASRTMILRSKTARVEQRVVLPHNSLLVLGWETNQKWKHAIDKDIRGEKSKRPDECLQDGQRISLTFRVIATYLHTPSGCLFGQGAICKTLPELKRMNDTKDEHSAKEKKAKSEAHQLLRAFALENAQSDFDWDEHYGCGFDTIAFELLAPTTEN